MRKKTLYGKVAAALMAVMLAGPVLTVHADPLPGDGAAEIYASMDQDGAAEIYASTDQDGAAEIYASTDQDEAAGGGSLASMDVKEAQEAFVPDQVQVERIQASFRQLAQKKTIMATVYLADRYEVKSGPDYGSVTVATLPGGSLVFLKDVEVAPTGVWYQADFPVDESLRTGYLEARNLAVSDEDFLQWEKSNLSGLYQETQLLVKAGNEDISQFPASYQPALLRLKSAHPNWTFVPMQVGPTWDKVIEAQCKGLTSEIYVSYPDAWKNGPADAEGRWFIASKAAVEYCVDPRNFLTENYIFMFEQLTYNASCHTGQAVQGILQNSFMSGVIPNEGITYAQAFFNIGSTQGISPFHLACRVRQEQGAGNSPLISGTYPGFEGYYNYYNINASGTSDDVIIKNGLTYAKSQGWDTRVKSLSGGATFLGKNYIMRGQDTLYLQKFNVSTYRTLSHQYMQNITAPQTEGAQIRKAYQQCNALDSPFVFKIPVYVGMPASPCPEPGTASQAPSDTSDVDKEGKLWAFVGRLYEQALGRPGDEEGMLNWYRQLKARVMTGADVAYGFFFSEEFKNRGLDDETYVDLLYSVMFDRVADAAGKEDWLQKLEGGMRREFVYRGFANALEFTQVCEEYGVERGEITEASRDYGVYRDRNEGVTGFVYRLYNKVLGRSGDDEGMENWCAVLLRGEQTAEEVAYGFVFSEEFLRKELSDGQYVDVMYRTFLNREPDAAGYADWTGRLAGGASRLEVFHGFTGSVEFRQIMDEYGVK